jgi:hypothetical protein
MFNKVIVAIDKVIDESGWDEPEKGYASSMVGGLFVSLMFFIPAFLFLLAVIIFSDENIFTVQTRLRLVLVIIVLDAMRNSGSK